MIHHPSKVLIPLLAFLLPLIVKSSFALEPSSQTRDSVSTDSSAARLEAGIEPRLILNEEELVDFDHEDFGDWLAILPGFYPLDYAGYAQPYRGQIMRLPSWTIDLHFRGRKVTNYLLGSPDLGWIPPESLSRLRFSPFSLESPGARLDAGLRTLEPIPPSSRLATRDGYYGLGTVDFNLAQKIAPYLLMNGGGRVSTYGGRHVHSEGYGLNLRAEIVWWDSTIAKQDSSGLWGWWGIMQNKRNSQVPFGTVNYNRDRYETDAVLNWRGISVRSYGIQQREKYGSGDHDSWDELGLIMGTDYGDEKLRGEFRAQAVAARWRLKTLDWASTAFGGAEANVDYLIVEALKVKSHLGLNLSDDFDPERHLGLSAEIYPTSWMTLFSGASQHQRWPSRLETSADFAPGTHYLPYDPAFYQYSGLNVLGNSDLKNETCSRLFAGTQLHASSLTGALVYVRYEMKDRIAWQVENGILRSFNALGEDADGALGWIKIYPLPSLQMGGTGSYLPLESDQRRIFPEEMAHAWVQYRQLAFKDYLDLRLRIWEDYWGERWFPVPGGWEKKGKAFVLSGRISARLYGVHIYWGVNNILSRRYDLLPGLAMMHKEEVWGISWNFID